jgi:hypothetical protein
LRFDYLGNRYADNANKLLLRIGILRFGGSVGDSRRRVDFHDRPTFAQGLRKPRKESVHRWSEREEAL